MFNRADKKLFGFIDIFSFIILVTNVAFIPLFLDKNLFNFYILPKTYLFAGLVIINVLLFALKIILAKKVGYKYSVLDIPILLLSFTLLISSLFSANRYTSFLGRNDFFVLNFTFLFFLVLFYFLIINLVNSKERWKLLVNVFLGVGGFSSLLFILKIIFKLDILEYLFSIQVLGVVSNSNFNFGVWLIPIFLVSLGNLLKKDSKWSSFTFYLIVAILSFIPLILLNFTILWWFVLAGLLLTVLYSVLFLKKIKTVGVSATFIILILVSVFLVFGAPKSWQLNTSTEISLGISPSWQVASDSVLSSAKNFILGSGPGTFGISFSKFRPNSFNYDQLAWSMRFNQPHSSILAFISEGGIIVVLMLAYIFVFLFGHIIQAIFEKLRENKIFNTFKNNLVGDDVLDILPVVTGWIILSFSVGFVFFNPVLWFSFWLLLGLTITGLNFSGSKLIKQKEITIEDTPQHSLSFSFIVIVLMAIIVLVGILGIRFYIAEVSYAKAVRSVDLTEANNYLNKALKHNKNFDLYYLGLANVYLAQASEASMVEEPNVKEVSALLSQAVESARQATNISPNSVAIWENLAVMYENTATLVPDALQWSIDSWKKAIELEPSNPFLYWRLGGNYEFAGDLAEAIKNYEEAIKIKKDYLGAYIALARVYEANNQLEEAMQTYQVVIQLNSDNPEVLFNYGRLLYNRNKVDDRDNAEKIWLAVVKNYPDFSNALYSLGLLYETKGQNNIALEYYYKVKELNPDNKDIVKKINFLIGS